MNRRICSKCKRVYNLVLNPPKENGICDDCGSELTARADDNEETIKNRLQTYFDQTSPLVDYYDKKGKLYSATVSQSINKMGPDVAKDIIAYLEEEK